MSETEYGWLIESFANGQIIYWQGGGMWNTDSLAGVRFCREKDAKAVMSTIPAHYDNESKPIEIRATEHGWG